MKLPLTKLIFTGSGITTFLRYALLVILISVIFQIVFISSYHNGGRFSHADCWKQYRLNGKQSGFQLIILEKNEQPMDFEDLLSKLYALVPETIRILEQ
jgi:hypothetical protein